MHGFERGKTGRGKLVIFEKEAKKEIYVPKEIKSLNLNHWLHWSNADQDTKNIFLSKLIRNNFRSKTACTDHDNQD